MPSLGPTARRLVATAALAALVPYLLWFRVEADTQFQGTQRVEDVYYTPSPRALPLLSLGYRRALASVLWVQALIYFGEQVAVGGHLRYLLDRTNAILALDPTFRDVYQWIAVVVVYNSTAITKRDIETSNGFLERGIRQFPRDGELRYMLAFNYAIELPSWTQDAEQKRAMRRRAAKLFAEAATLPGAPPDAAVMAVEMGRKGGDRALAIAYLRRLLDSATTDSVRDQLVQRLAMETSQQEADLADADRQQLLSTWKRDWPYLPPDMFALVGARFGTDLAVASDEIEQSNEPDAGGP